MDSIDKKLLVMIQDKFPISQRPYMEIGEKLSISENEVIERIKVMKESGLIRRMGGVFDSRKLGYKSTLCAMEVSEEKLPEVIEIVNSYIGVTHNYIRRHEYNLWFTLITPSKEHLDKVVNEITEKTGIKVNNLPAERLFKIKVNFHIPGEGEKENA
ncbi:transcriptional regulator, AsnC family [Desulfonispora thiosulfatigenes DSM 11270]|uniref:siroheme decarboxylase n=1 Tax=Desulfonispora thiosulfatigenes DSM 11270 TaxID=656914 RepID=A0A1W1VFR6_DESTI|nr:AsnC family transcriptional regulator [Desulfonispora thiosulfatigenes]SMB92249.1 transcriptional regulator, AsnC family [Desulfonispora thiosulfatigenes DSM 11270]